MSAVPNRPIIQKHNHLRAPKLLRQAKDAPCMNCGAEDGTIVPAHENSLAAGKGYGIKSDDLVAFLCLKCHQILDGPDLSRIERPMFFNAAFKRTIKWMLQNGKLKVVE